MDNFLRHDWLGDTYEDEPLKFVLYRLRCGCGKLPDLNSVLDAPCSKCGVTLDEQTQDMVYGRPK